MGIYVRRVHIYQVLVYCAFGLLIKQKTCSVLELFLGGYVFRVILIDLIRVSLVEKVEAIFYDFVGVENPFS